MNSETHSRGGRPAAAFVVSLIAGLWMLWASAMMGWGHIGGYGWGHGVGGGPGGGYGWMWHHHQMMYGYGGGSVWSWIDLGAGVVTVIGSAILYARPGSARRWGIAIVVVSVVDLLAGPGGLLAGGLGVVGGILAVTWRSAGGR